MISFGPLARRQRAPETLSFRFPCWLGPGVATRFWEQTEISVRKFEFDGQKLSSGNSLETLSLYLCLIGLR